MWAKTATGFFAGLFISLGFALTLVKLLPGPVDMRLFITVLMVFVLWVAILFYCYVTTLNRQTYARICWVIGGFVVLNGFLYK
jgi:hypothetical protein